LKIGAKLINIFTQNNPINKILKSERHFEGYAVYIKIQTFKNMRLPVASFVSPGKGKVGSTSVLLSHIPAWMQFPHYPCAMQFIVFAGVCQQ
jgi:hypothetical protein